MIYNWDIGFLEMEEKRKQCFKWGVQVSDCRYRPVDQLHDRYNPAAKRQTDQEYHIHSKTGWDDSLVRQFRRNVREHNICVRHGLRLYVKEFETKRAPKKAMKEAEAFQGTLELYKFLIGRGYRPWNPAETRVPKGYDRRTAKPL